MNEQMKAEALREPWREREKLPPVGRVELGVSAAAVLLSSLGLCFSTSEKVAFFFLLPLLFLTVWGLRAPGSVTAVLLTATLASVLTGSLSGAAFVLSLVLGTGNLAWLFTVQARPYAAAIPLAAALVGFAVTREPATAALATVFLPAAALLAVATVTHQRRTTAICFCIGGFLISLLAALALFFYATLGSLEPSAISTYFDALRASLTEELLAVRDAFLAAMRESVAGTVNAAEVGETLTTLENTLTPAILGEIVSLFFSILPALAVMAISIISFEAQLCLNLTYYRTGWRDVLTLKASAFSMSVVSAVIYVVGFLLTMFIDTGSVFGAAVQNITLMLLPGFCVMGFGAILASLKLSRGGQRVFLIVLLVFSVCCAGLSIFYFLALWGAYAAIMTALHVGMLQKLAGAGKDKNDPNDPDDPDGGDGGQNGEE